MPKGPDRPDIPQPTQFWRRKMLAVWNSWAGACAKSLLGHDSSVLREVCVCTGTGGRGGRRCLSAYLFVGIREF